MIWPAASCRATRRTVDRVNQRFVSSVKRALSALMQRLAVERTGSDWPALCHAGPDTGESRLLRRGQVASTANGHEPRNRPAIAGNDVLRTSFDLTNAAGEALVGLAQAYRIAHIRAPGSRPRHSAISCYICWNLGTSSPTCTPMRKRIGSPAAPPGSSVEIAFCTATAHATASTALAKSGITLSPAVLKMRPRWVAISPSMMTREALSRANVPTSSCDISRV